MKKTIFLEKESTPVRLKNEMLQSIKHSLWILSLLIFCSCIGSASLFAQSPYSIKGAVTDTSSIIKLQNTTISILNSKDSTLVDFTRAIPDGSFSINNLTKGKFILLVTRNGYTDYVEQFSLDSINRTRDFGKLNMITKARLLAEVVIRNRAAIVVKGDTTEYNAERYVIPPNSKVEDLIRQFPGIEVDKDGNITAQGKRVTKFLVDGEEFFSDDPTLITRNFRGDMIDKVQLYEKKSDNAMFTGVEDGQRTTTMNFVLKEDKKKGYFGNTNLGYAGASEDDLTQGQGMFNYFQPMTKFAIGGKYSYLGLSSAAEDLSKFGLASSGLGVGRTNPYIDGAAAHFDTKWNKAKEFLNIDYTRGSTTAHGIGGSGSLNTQADDAIKQVNTSVYSNNNVRQTLAATYRGQANENSMLNITLNGSLSNQGTANSGQQFFTGSNNILQNKQNNITSADNDVQSLGANINWTRRFKKVGRNLTLGINQSYNKTLGKTFRDRTTEYYDHDLGTLDSIKNLNQYKPSNNRTFSLNNRIGWTEPLSKVFSLNVNYALGIKNNSNDADAFNKNVAGQYVIPDPEFSSNFETNDLSNIAGASLGYSKNKTYLSFGGNINATRSRRVDITTGDNFSRSYINVYPSATYSYRSPSPQKSFSMSYYGSTSEPSAASIQPLKSNDNGLYTTVGNPNLRSSFASNFSMNYTSYKTLGSRSFSIYGNYSLTSNQIIQNNTVDASGNTLLQYANLTDKTPSSYSLSTNYRKVLKKSGITITGSLSGSGGTSYGFLNSKLNATQRYSASASLGLNKYVTNKYLFAASFTPDYQSNALSLNPLGDAHLWHSLTNAWFWFFLPKKVELLSDVNYHYWGKNENADANSTAVWCATVRKKFLKASNLMVSLTANDLLKQTKGYSRTLSSQTNNDVTVTRYFLASIIWDFSKFGKSRQPVSGPGQQPAPQPRPMPAPQPRAQPQN